MVRGSDHHLSVDRICTRMVVMAPWLAAIVTLLWQSSSRCLDRIAHRFIAWLLSHTPSSPSFENSGFSDCLPTTKSCLFQTIIIGNRYLRSAGYAHSPCVSCVHIPSAPISTQPPKAERLRERHIMHHMITQGAQPFST